MSKSYKVDDEHRWGNVVDLRIGNEIDGEKILGEEYKGYVLRIAGGSDMEGFAMKNGVLRKGRARLLIPPRTPGLRYGREGERKRRSVRGAIVDRDVGTLHFTILTKGANEIKGLTDVKTPRRLGPKRANKIRKLFGLPKHSDRIGKKDKQKVHVDRFDVCRYVVKRPVKPRGDKQYYKAPKIQRLITSQRLRRKRDSRKAKVEAVTANNAVYKQYVERLKAAAAERKKKQAETQAATTTAAPATAKTVQGTTAKTAAPAQAKPAQQPAAKTQAPAQPAKTALTQGKTDAAKQGTQQAATGTKPTTATSQATGKPKGK